MGGESLMISTPAHHAAKAMKLSIKIQAIVSISALPSVVQKVSWISRTTESTNPKTTTFATTVLMVLGKLKAKCNTLDVKSVMKGAPNVTDGDAINAQLAMA